MTIARFKAAYVPALAALYATPEYQHVQYDAATVAERMLANPAAVNWGRDNAAQRAACKTLGIPCTRTAILAYLRETV